MKLLKRLLTIIMILAISQTSNADCANDCKAALNAADKLISSLKEEISTYKQLTEKQQEALINTQVTLNDKNHELESIFRNPYFMVTVGIIIGGGLTLYLTK